MAVAADSMGVSVRQARRLRAAYRKQGVVGLAHGNRGRRPHNALGEAVARRFVALARERHRGVNQQHLTELLEEEAEIRLSRSRLRPSCCAPGSGVHGRDGRRSIAAGGSARRGRVCFCRWTAVRTTGWRDGRPHPIINASAKWIPVVALVDSSGV